MPGIVTAELTTGHSLNIRQWLNHRRGRKHFSNDVNRQSLSHMKCRWIVKESNSYKKKRRIERTMVIIIHCQVCLGPWQHNIYLGGLLALNFSHRSPSDKLLNTLLTHCTDRSKTANANSLNIRWSLRVKPRGSIKS